MDLSVAASGIPLISVVIVCGPGSDDPDEAIRSVVAQRYPVTEILLVGARPQLGTAAEVRSVTYHGLAPEAALNAATAQSRGDYIVFLEACDRLLPGALESGAASLEDHPSCGFTSGRHRTVSSDGSVLSEAQPAPRVTGDHYVELVRGDYRVDVAAAVMYRRSVLESSGGFDTSLTSSTAYYEMCLRILRRMPAYFHGNLVASHLEVAGGVDAVSRYIASVQVLRSQERYLSGRVHYLEAYRAGMAQMAQRHGLELFEELRVSLRRRDQAPATSTVYSLVRFLAALLRWSPAAIPSVASVCFLPVASRRWPLWRRIEAFVGSSATSRRPSSVHRIRDAARAAVPTEATVLVVAEESDDELLQLDGRRALRLSPTERVDGHRALAALPGEGADFLLVPSGAFWWLDHYHADLKSDLETSRRRAWTNTSCEIYSLEDAEPVASRRALVAGFFSFEHAGATAGDILARDVACEWLVEAECPYDVAVATPFEGGVDWRSVDPQKYTHVVFVCGPYLDNRGQRELLGRFAGAHLIGLNLSMPRLDGASPFHLLLERDGSEVARPDISLRARHPRVPVVGLCIREHSEGTRAANTAIRRLISSMEMSVVEIDTRLDANTTGLRTAAEVESLLGRMDLVVTTRLHGMVLALKHGVPVVAVDPQPGGQKITRQAEAIGWPVVLKADAITDEALQAAFRYCQTAAAREKARECSAAGEEALQDVRRAFIDAL